MGIARYTMSYSIALRKSIKNLGYELKRKDLEQTLRVNAFLAPGNISKHGLYFGPNAQPPFKPWSGRIRNRGKIKGYLPHDGFFKTGVYGKKAIDTLLV